MRISSTLLPSPANQRIGRPGGPQPQTPQPAAPDDQLTTALKNLSFSLLGGSLAVSSIIGAAEESGFLMGYLAVGGALGLAVAIPVGILSIGAFWSIASLQSLSSTEDAFSLAGSPIGLLTFAITAASAPITGASSQTSQSAGEIASNLESIATLGYALKEGKSSIEKASELAHSASEVYKTATKVYEYVHDKLSRLEGDMFEGLGDDGKNYQIENDRSDAIDRIQDQGSSVTMPENELDYFNLDPPPEPDVTTKPVLISDNTGNTDNNSNDDGGSDDWPDDDWG